MAQRDLTAFVIPLSRRLAEEMGYEWVDAELVKEGPGRYLRIYLDKTGGITLDDCEAYHRAIQPRLEKVEYDFLEISSPGVDRPLKTERDFSRAVGAEIEVRLYKPVDGAKVFTGTLMGYDETSLRLKTQGGERTLARRDAALIKPVVRFDEEFIKGECEE